MNVTYFLSHDTAQGATRRMHFDAFHFKEATNTQPPVEKGKWCEPCPIPENDALRLVNKWNQWGMNSPRRDGTFFVYAIDPNQAPA